MKGIRSIEYKTYETVVNEVNKRRTMMNTITKKKKLIIIAKMQSVRNER